MLTGTISLPAGCVPFPSILLRLQRSEATLNIMLGHNLLVHDPLLSYLKYILSKCVFPVDCF